MLAAAAFGAALAAAPLAAQPVDDRTALSEYLYARAADASGSLQEAAQGYAAVLAQAPFEEALAARAYRRAVAAGDRQLALTAARSLEAANALPPDGEFLFLAEALDRRDWAAARRAIDRIEEDGLFQSLVPLMRAWIAYGADDGDPLAILDQEDQNLGATSYVAEHRALLLLAMRRFDDGIEVLEGLQGLGQARTLRLNLAAAAQLAAHRRRDEALTLIGGDSRAETAARRVIERRRRLPGAIDSASDGIAELLVRLSADVNARNVSALALTLSRFATFLSPDNSIAWLVTTAILDTADQHQAALAALDQVPAGDPFFEDAQDMRVRLLVSTGEQEAALELARAQTGSRDATAADWSRIGEIYSNLERHDAAVDAYQRALDMAGNEQAPWTAWLLYGGALLDAERWPEARPALDRAVELAPDEPVVLNYLGYAMLERRENLPRAEELIRRASELQPDSAAITDSLGWVHFVQGDLDQAIPLLESASIGDPDEPTINEHLGDAYWTAGRRRDARFAWQAALVTAEEAAAARIREKLDFGLTPETISP